MSSSWYVGGGSMLLARKFRISLRSSSTSRRNPCIFDGDTASRSEASIGTPLPGAGSPIDAGLPLNVKVCDELAPCVDVSVCCCCSSIASSDFAVCVMYPMKGGRGSDRALVFADAFRGRVCSGA